jgi:hypothetical protein
MVKDLTLARIRREDMPKLKMAQAILMQERRGFVTQEDVLKVLLEEFIQKGITKSKATTPVLSEVPL